MARRRNFCLPLLAAMALTAALAILIAPSGALAGELQMDVPKSPVPAFQFKGDLAGGGELKLSDLRGKVVFLNFWATWCPPCRAEMPAMERLAQKMKGRPFHMVAVNQMEKMPTVKKFLAKARFTYDILMDPDGTISENYNAENLPVTYVIDKQGNIIRRAIGPRIWDGEESVALFKKLAAQ